MSLEYEPLPGDTPAERRRYMRERIDSAPCAIVFEPEAAMEPEERSVLDRLVDDWLASEEASP